MMKWNVKNIAFLYQPDVFSGTFSSPQMQERHEKEVAEKLEALTTAVAKEPSPLKAMNLLHKKDRLQFLLNNTTAFTLAGDYEEAVLSIYLTDNGPFLSAGNAEQWNGLFNKCNKETLHNLGTSVTFERTTIYRGSVSGFQRSLCWTTEKKTAEYLLNRWSNDELSGGELFEAEISKDNVMVYLEDPREPILLLHPEMVATLEIHPFTGK